MRSWRIHHYIAAHGLHLVCFRKGEERKDDIAKRCLAEATRGNGTVTEEVLFAGTRRSAW